MTKLQRLIRRPAPERGFTLIELLVVIIILGILAAVVVFAVGGVGDKGKSSAVTIDARTLRTAEEAYCAKNGQYGSGQELITGGFLSDSPEYHNVSAQRTGFGQCNGWTYSIVETEEASGVAASTWAAAASPAGGGGTMDVIRLPSGKVVSFGFDIPFQWATSIWSPATGTWASLDVGPFGAGPAFNLRFNLAPVLTQNCGVHCGKILFKAQAGWQLFNPEAPSGAQWTGIGGDTSSPGETLNTFTELRDNPSTAANECGSNCGKILIINERSGGPADLYDPNTGPTGGFTPVANSDPLVNAANFSALLPDGRILLVGATEAPVTPAGTPFALFFDPIALTFSNAPPPPVALYSSYTGEPAPPVMANGDILFGGAATINGDPASQAIYTPQYGQAGAWRSDPIPPCGPSGSFCQVLGSLPDGRVLAYAGSSPDRFQPSSTNPGQSFLLNRDPSTNAYAWSRSGDFDSGAAGDGELLDPRTGPCGVSCNKMFMVGQPFAGGTYNAAFFTP